MYKYINNASSWHMYDRATNAIKVPNSSSIVTL